MQPSRDDTADFQRRPSCDGRARTVRRAHDRPLLLAHPERLEGQHHARGVRPALSRAAGEHRPGRAVLPCLLEAFAEQPHARHRRRRSSRRRRAAPDLRERGDSPVPRREDRPLPAARRARQVRRPPVGRVAGREPRPHRRTDEPLRRLRAGKDPVRDRPLRQRDEPAARRPRAAPRGPLLPRRRLLDRRHGDVAVDLPRVPGPQGARGLPEGRALVGDRRRPARGQEGPRGRRGAPPERRARRRSAERRRPSPVPRRRAAADPAARDLAIAGRRC